MATASTVVLIALVALAFGNLQMIDALIDACGSAKIGSNEVKYKEPGKWHEDLGYVDLPKYIRQFKLLIPSKDACAHPIGVSIRVCDILHAERPKVTFASFDVAYVSLTQNNDPQQNAFFKVLVTCMGVPNGYGKNAKVTVVPLFA